MLIRRVAYAIIAGASCVHIVHEYLGELILLVGPSMLPTLNSNSSGDVVVMERITRHLGTLQRGDITIARSPQDPNSLICKRIAAMAGDIVETGPEEEDYIKVPKGHLWLLGDNAEDSTDSRDYGSVPYGLVKGRVCFKLWPLSEFGRIESPKKTSGVQNG
ncbi:mitochondrial inner membrane protease subunit 1-like [Actinia tenebrosa]|uniref:Mitochondrial inner membrane protease subunit 1-like n=1 Tax=Actinia tenebrosa TaxID=6105 RepID=A0A6P8HWY4_ACTTE|nr:mitochondrial inner membrane protease subunit 1-like [Actinia tenebrosa]